MPTQPKELRVLATKRTPFGEIRAVADETGAVKIVRLKGSAPTLDDRMAMLAEMRTEREMALVDAHIAEALAGKRAAEAKLAGVEAERDRLFAERDAAVARIQEAANAHHAATESMKGLAASLAKTIADLPAMVTSAVTAQQAPAMSFIANAAAATGASMKALTEKIAARDTHIDARMDGFNVAVDGIGRGLGSLSANIESLRSIAAADKRVTTTRADGTTVETVVKVERSSHE